MNCNLDSDPASKPLFYCSCGNEEKKKIRNKHWEKNVLTSPCLYLLYKLTKVIRSISILNCFKDQDSFIKSPFAWLCPLAGSLQTDSAVT